MMNFLAKLPPVAYLLHYLEIRRLSKKYTNISKPPTTFKRAIWVLLATILTFGLMNWFKLIHWDGWIPHWATQLTNNTDTSFIKLSHLIITAPIFFAIWAFRDASRLHEIANQRKDTNLKEFQQLQEWATDNTDDNIALKISALHSLRAYLKGEYGQSFRRGAFEIFASELSTQHTKILQQVTDNDDLTIKQAIDNNPLCKQLNRIVKEDWFNLLISHNFPTATISLVGVDLSVKYLRHKDFGKSLSLSNANLQGADLRGAKLQGADLRGAKLQGADLVGTELQGAYLIWAKLQGADLSEAKLQGAYLIEAKLQGADLRWAKLQGADLRWAKLQGADLFGAELQGVVLSEAKLQGAYLSGADLSKAKLQGVVLSEAQLQGADLDGAQLQGADLRKANLQGANLRWAKLQGADLRWAKLQGADLRYAQLQGADLDGAQLQGANLVVTKLQGGGVSKTLDSLRFVKRINQQTNKATDIQTLEAQYKPLEAEQKEKIIAEFSKIKAYWIKDAIELIKNASDALDLSKAETGSYDKQQAQQWIEQYKKDTLNAKKAD